MNWGRPQVLLGVLAIIVASGTVFFRYVEDWSWLDAYFFTVVTLSTVGYGSLVPETALGKIGATAYIFTGIGVFALAIQQFGEFTLRRRVRKRAQRLEEAETRARETDRAEGRKE